MRHCESAVVGLNLTAGYSFVREFFLIIENVPWCRSPDEMIFGHSFESMNENSEFFSSTVTVASLKFKNIFEIFRIKYIFFIQFSPF